MSRDTEILPPGPHGWQQFRTKEVRTGVRTISRACNVCGQFFLRKYRLQKELDEAGLRFLRHNRTPCEDD